MQVKQSGGIALHRTDSSDLVAEKSRNRSFSLLQTKMKPNRLRQTYVVVQT
jgi:hypothetical protein